MDKPFWWVLGIVGATMAGGITSVMGHGERIAKIEAEQAGELLRLQRIETKVDRILFSMRGDK